MKYFVFITAIMLMLTACTQQSGPDKTTVSEDLPNIKLVFEPYDFEFAETPDLSDWQRMPDANYDNLLGYPVRIEKYRCDLPGEMYGTYYIHGIHKETSESLFTMLREISCYDVDNDGCYEMGFGNLQDEVVMYYMVKRGGEDLEFAEINMPFVEYILKHLNKDADFTYYTRLNGNFGYTVYSENHKAYTDHFLYAEFYGNGYNITYERSFSYAGDVPFESNSPEWMMEIGYDEIVSRGDQPMKIGKLLLHGPDGQLYTYTEDDIPMNLSADTIHARELIVHPSMPYAVLIVPYFTEFAEDMQGTCLYLLDLASGEIVERITPLSIYLEGNPNIEEAKTTLGKTDILGFATHRFENQVQTTNNGFQIIVQLCNADDTEVAHNTIDVTLPIQTKIAIPDLADKVYHEPSVITTNSTIWLPEIINKEYKVFATEQLEYAIACAPTHKWKYDSDISYYVHDSGMRVRKYDLMLYRLIRVPKGSFSSENGELYQPGIHWENPTMLTWGTDKKHILTLTNLSDDSYDCLALFVINVPIAEENIDLYYELIEHMELQIIPLRILNENEIVVYQLNNNALLFVSSDGGWWVLDEYVSDNGFDAFLIDQNQVGITIYQQPNTYQITVHPITHKVTDMHLTDNDVKRKFNVEDGHLSSVCKQTLNGTIWVQYLYPDRIVEYTENNGEITSNVIQLLYDTEPIGENRFDFYEIITNAITYQNPNNTSHHWCISVPGASYFFAENAAYYTLDTYRYYLSCLFTSDSVDALMQRKVSILDRDYMFVRANPDGMLYILDDLTHIDSVPEYEQLAIVKENGYWRCDITKQTSYQSYDR